MNLPVALATALVLAAVPAARSELIPAAAHMPNMEDPARVNRLLGEFLAGR